jgi:hypothetical protein
MKKYILLNYYRDYNEERRREYLFCVKKNLDLNFIDRLIIFIENDDYKNDLNLFNASKKISFIKINKRFEFKDAINYSKKILKNSVIIIINLDIYLDDSLEWKNIDKIFFIKGHPNKALVCYRHDINKKLLSKNISVMNNKSLIKGDSCDAWVLKTPFDKNFLKQNFNFCVGNAPGCDGLMMSLMNNYYHLYSWGKKYKIFHYDIIRKTVVNKTKYNIYNNSYILNHRADIRPTLRFNEWINVPIKQNWNYFIKSKTKPNFFYPNKNFTILRLIYRIYIFRLNQIFSLVKEVFFKIYFSK